MQRESDRKAGCPRVHMSADTDVLSPWCRGSDGHSLVQCFSNRVSRNVRFSQNIVRGSSRKVPSCPFHTFQVFGRAINIKKRNKLIQQ